MSQKITLAISAEEVLAHPRFDAARQVYVREILRFFENQPSLNRLLMDVGTAFIFFTIITRYANYVPNVRSSWPTMEQLKQEMETHGVASGRRARDIVRRLIDTGYVETQKMPEDKRATLIVPTEKMLAHDRHTLVIYYHPLHVMFPEPGYPEPMQRDRAFQRVARRIGLAFVGHSHEFMMSNPVGAFFFPRQAGHMILTLLIHLCQGQDDDAPPQVPFIKMGDIFGVSRTHVRKLLREAEEMGFVRLDGNRAAVTAACRAGFDRFLADTMAGNDMVYRLSMKEMASGTVQEDGSLFPPTMAEPERQVSSG